MTSCMWTTNATSGMICRCIICNFGAQKLRLFERRVNTLQGRVVEFAPGEQSVDRATLHSVCKENIHTNCTQNIYLYGRELQTSKTDHQARSHSPTKFRPLTSAGVAKWVLNLSQNNCICILVRSPSAGTEKDDRIRELEIMVRSLEEKLTR